MGGSLSVFKIKKNIEKLKDKLILYGDKPNQKALEEFNIGNKKLPQPQTTIIFDKKIHDFYSFKVHHESNILFESIIVYKWDILEDNGSFEVPEYKTNKGYKREIDFTILVNKKTDTLYIFCPKDDAKILINRLKLNLDIELEPYRFDLSKIDLIPQIIDEWGAWVIDTGNVLKHGFFGHKIKKVMEGNEHNVTTYNVLYELKGGESQIDLTISRMGRISSKSLLIKNDLLLKIFEDLKQKLEFLEPPKI